VNQLPLPANDSRLSGMDHLPLPEKVSERDHSRSPGIVGHQAPLPENDCETNHSRTVVEPLPLPKNDSTPNPSRSVDQLPLPENDPAPNPSRSPGTTADHLLLPKNVSETNDSRPPGTVTDQLTLPKIVSETNTERILEAKVVTETISNSFPTAEVETNGGTPPADVQVGPDTTVDQGATVDLPEIPAGDRLDHVRGLLPLLLSDPSDVKVRCAILLLRGLLQQQPQSSPSHSAVDVEDTDIASRHPFPSANGEGPFTMEGQLELVMRCSSLLSKNPMVPKGRELEVSMSERAQVQQEPSDTRNVATESDVNARSHSPVRVDKEVATEDISELLNQGQGIERVEKSVGTTRDPETDTVTGVGTIMADPSSFPSNLPGTIQPVTQLLTSTTPDLADPLNCTHDVDLSDGGKGKGRAPDVVGPTRTPDDLPLFSTLLRDFKSMKEEMRRSEQRDKEETETIARLWAELSSLKEQMRPIDEYRGDVEKRNKRRREEEEEEEEISVVVGLLRAAKRQKMREDMEEGNLPLPEILELQHRMTALENSIGSLTRSPSGPYSRPFCEDDSDFQRPPRHPFGHLLNYEDPVSTVSGYRPGAPIQSEPSNEVIINRIPLPIKSQRKFQLTHGR
jgi:hypothetical protein